MLQKVLFKHLSIKSNKNAEILVIAEELMDLQTPMKWTQQTPKMLLQNSGDRVIINQA